VFSETDCFWNIVGDTEEDEILRIELVENFMRLEASNFD